VQRSRKCELCHDEEAVYAMQYIASIEPSLYTLGSHIRGFPVLRVCSKCGAEQKYVAEQAKKFLALSGAAA